MKGDQVVLQRDDRPAEAPLETPDLRAALVYALQHDTYLTSEEAALYIRSASLPAFREWRRRHAVRCVGSSRRLLFRRRDLDEALKPVAERGRRSHLSSLKGGRS